MPRPTKCRKVEFFPNNTCFTPKEGGDNNRAIELKVEELQAMRLKDIEELSQEECAKRMDISRQTFQNIIDSARKKVAMALCEGIVINISGGDYTTKFCRFQCSTCGNHYEMKFEQDKYICPKCGGNLVSCSRNKEFCKKWCRGGK